MAYIVAKPFHSWQRRFRLGAEIGHGEDLSPHTIASLQNAGLIVDRDAPPSAKTPRAAAAAAAKSDA